MAAREHRAVRPKITARLADPEQRRELRVARSWGYTLEQWRNLSEDDRDLLLADDALVCSRCGNLRSECSDPSIDWHPQESVCWASATLDWGWRRLRDKHKNFNHEKRDATGELVMSPLDGVSLWVSDVDLEALSPSEAPADEVRQDGYQQDEGDLPQGG